MKGESDEGGTNTSGNENKSTVPVSEWKNYLSGAMSDTQLYLALGVLLVFYTLFTHYTMLTIV